VSDIPAYTTAVLFTGGKSFIDHARCLVTHSDTKEKSWCSQENKNTFFFIFQRFFFLKNWEKKTKKSWSSTGVEHATRNLKITGSYLTLGERENVGKIFDKMSVDKMSVDKMSVDKMSVDEMSVDKMSRQNVCRQNVCRQNVCRQNVCRQNVCKQNVCAWNVFWQNGMLPINLW
jgi:hypothetical protein